MKFRIEKKDLLIFVAYCLGLLYVCALVVSNLTSILEFGEFDGLLPLRAFTSRYFILTLVLFVVILIVIFTNVSSYIFNKEKGMGVGLKIGKGSSDGYSKWATEKEIKNAKDIEKVTSKDKNVQAAGIPVINNNKAIYVDNGEYHNLVLGSTGSGKTETLVKPMVNLLARKGESMVITDPKGEIYKYTVENLKSKGYNVVLLNFREPQRGNTWNPLSLPYEYHLAGNRDKSTELINDIAVNMFVSDKSDDPFWEKTSADYFAGLTLALFEDAKKEEINLNSINYMSTIGEERYAANGTFIKEYFTLKGESSRPYIFASSTISAPNETKGSILSTFRQKIRIFSATENLSEMLSTSNFDMRDIGKQKTAVFLVIHDEKKTYHSLMTIFIKQCYEILIDVAQENGGQLEYRTNFILDEFANMPALKDVDSMVSAARSRLIRFTFIIQNFAQLTQVYGEHIAEVIKGNCGNMIYLISTEMKALEEISKMCGEVKSGEKEKTTSTPLITVSDLQKLKMFQAIIIRLRTNPFKTDLTPNFKIDWGEEYPLGDFPHRKFEEVQLFDVKKYVMEEKRKKQMNGPGFEKPERTFSPFGGEPMNSPMAPQPMPMKPFGNMDIDAMLKDIDAKIKEFEDKEKEEQEAAKKELVSTTEPKKENIIEVVTGPTSIEESKIETPKVTEETKEIEQVKVEGISKVAAPVVPVSENETNSLEQSVPLMAEEKIVEEPKVERRPLFSKEFKPEIEEEREKNTKIIVDTASKIVETPEISDDEYYDDFFEV
ncbi:MAG: type IV secretory system conjugative DNA transfer family protein [bacterium]